MDLGVSGLASGFDWRTLVDKLADVERTPQTRLRVEQGRIQERINAYGSIKTQLGVLQSRVDTLKSTELFSARTASVSDATVASATAATGAVTGAYTFNITQLARPSSQLGATGAGKAINTSDDVSGVVIGNAGFSVPITAGTFTVQGKQVTVATTDTLQQVFDNISAATGGQVTASYSAATDRVTLSSASTIVLGSATDTSNFLRVTRLSNNGTGAVTSSAALGGVKMTGSLANANFATTISDGGSGAGELKINGVSISFSATADSVQTVLDRINSSAAGVTASYDIVNNRFTLTNKVTGDLGVALEDVTGNFLAATNLSAGALQRGQDLLYTINGGQQLRSQSNTITDESSGLTGLSVTALKENSSVVVNVSSDTAKVKTAISDFLTEYNKLQTMIDTETASSTDSKGKVTAGTLSGEMDAYDISSQLRKAAYTQVEGLSGVLDHLEDIGIVSNGDDNTLKVSDSEKLDDALANNMGSVQTLFTDSSKGIAIQLADYLDRMIGDEGSLVTKQSNLTAQSANIDTQIADMERIVESNRQRLIGSFVAMETVQAKINQQLQFLQQRFGSTK